MKIPSPLEKFRGTSNSHADTILAAWRNEAINLSMEHGIFIEVQFELGNDLVPIRIWFEVMGHKFESSMDLRKALVNKAFL